MVEDCDGAIPIKSAAYDLSRIDAKQAWDLYRLDSPTPAREREKVYLSV